MKLLACGIAAVICVAWTADRAPREWRPPASDQQLPDSDSAEAAREAIRRPLHLGDTRSLRPVEITPTRRIVPLVSHPPPLLPAPKLEPELIFKTGTREEWAIALLTQLGAPAHPNAIAFLIGWQKSENCDHHNPFCRLDSDRRPYRYASAQAGARAMAAQLDPEHEARPGEWRASYPHIVAVLRDAASYPNARAVAEAVAEDLHRWCGPAKICGHDSYPQAVARRSEESERR